MKAWRELSDRRWLGFAVGSAPWWLALIQSGGVLLAEMTGAAVAGTVEAPSFIGSLGIRLINFLLFGLVGLVGRALSVVGRVCAAGVGPGGAGCSI